MGRGAPRPFAGSLWLLLLLIALAEDGDLSAQVKFIRGQNVAPVSKVSLTTWVTFDAAGTYLLRAIASDGLLESFHDVAVTVN
jgi:hypothetical protein